MVTCREGENPPLEELEALFEIELSLSFEHGTGRSRSIGERL
jgi:hypothetical protein